MRILIQVSNGETNGMGLPFWESSGFVLAWNRSGTGLENDGNQKVELHVHLGIRTAEN